MWSFLATLDPRVITAIAVAVGTVAAIIGWRNYRLARDRDRRERERERQQLEEAAQAQREFRASFTGVSVPSCGETVHVVWDGPLERVTEHAVPRIMTPELGTALEQAIRAEGEDAHLDLLESPKSVPVYETDENLTWKRKVKGPPGPDGRFYLKVFP